MRALHSRGFEHVIVSCPHIEVRRPPSKEILAQDGQADKGKDRCDSSVGYRLLIRTERLSSLKKRRSGILGNSINSCVGNGHGAPMS